MSRSMLQIGGGRCSPEPVGSGCSIHEEEQRREEGYASIGCPGSPESSRDGGRRVGGGGRLRGRSERLSGGDVGSIPGDGTSKSAVSRKFVALSNAEGFTK